MAIFRFKITEPGNPPFFANVGPHAHAQHAAAAIAHSFPEGTEITLKEPGESEEPPKVEVEDAPVVEAAPVEKAEPSHPRDDAGGLAGVE